MIGADSADKPHDRLTGVGGEVVGRPDWRDSLALAADLALLGIVVTLACLPVVTAGAALATASVAADHTCAYRTLPSAGTLWRVFRGALLPGLGVTGAGVGAALLLYLDLRALAAGAVPGGVPLLIVTGLVAAGGLAVALLALVRVGATDGRRWLAAAGWAGRQLLARPWLGPALLLVTAIPVVLALAIPVLTPLLAGLWIFALHVTLRRAAP